MKITLKNMQLHHFKGSVSQSIDFADKTVIRGRNGTGKTTLFDAFLWCLFGKDSQGKADFQVKPVGVDGEEIHNLQTSVVLTLEADGITTMLKRELTENWVKPRGTQESKFAGNVTAFFIDDVPQKKGDYDKKVAEIFSEQQVFQLVTDPMAFIRMDWKKRRKTLLDLFDGVDIAQVIPCVKGADKLDGDLSKHTPEELLTARKQKRKLTADNIDKNTHALEERQRDTEGAPADVAALNAELSDIDDKIRRMKEADPSVTVKNQIADLERELKDERHLLSDKHRDSLRESQQAVKSLESNLRELEKMRMDVLDDIDKAKSEKRKAERSLEECRAEWRKFDQMSAEVQESCPSCGQDIPADKVQSAREAINTQKAEGKKKASEAGSQLKSDIQVLDDATEKLDELLKGTEEKIRSIQNDIDHLKSLVHAVEEAEKTATSDKAEDLKKRIENLKQTLTAGNAVADTSALDARRAEIAHALRNEEKRMDGIERVKELTEQRDSLRKQADDIEADIVLLEEIIKLRSSMLEEKLNVIPGVKFKLFHQNDCGSIEECCDILVNGVPAGDSLNHGAEVNAGLAILDMLSEKYGVTAPVWVDNAESVTGIHETAGQMILLVVDENAKIIEVKYE